MENESFDTLLANIRASLTRVRTSAVQQELEQVLDLLASARTSPFEGSFFEEQAPPQVRDAFHAALRKMTAADRDEATDALVLAITFAIGNDETRSRDRLATLAGLTKPGLPNRAPAARIRTVTAE